MRFSKLDEFMVKRGGSVDPSRFKNETFELLSIPAFDQGRPEIVEGENIGSSKKIVTPRDVLLSKIVPHIRRCWIVPALSNKRQIASGEWIQFRGEDFVPEYLRLFLVSNGFHSQFMKTVKGIGGSLLRASPEQVGEIEIPLPPLNDQIRIAHLLGKVEGLIAQRKQHLQQLNDLLKSVFLEMFGDPVRNETGWDKPELKGFGKISTGNTPPRNDPANYDDDFIEWIKTDNITGDAVFVTSSAEHLSEAGTKRGRTVSRGALLVACIAGSVESIGRAALTDRTVAFNQQINAIQPSKDVNPLYLYGLFKLSRAYIQSHATKGMKKILTKGDFELIKMIKPPIDLQNQFAVIVEKIEGLKTRYQQSLSHLETLYGALSQQAFMGELDLSRVPLPPTEGCNHEIYEMEQVWVFCR